MAFSPMTKNVARASWPVQDPQDVGGVGGVRPVVEGEEDFAAVWWPDGRRHWGAGARRPARSGRSRRPSGGAGTAPGQLAGPVYSAGSCGPAAVVADGFVRMRRGRRPWWAGLPERRRRRRTGPGRRSSAPTTTAACRSVRRVCVHLSESTPHVLSRGLPRERERHRGGRVPVPDRPHPRGVRQPPRRPPGSGRDAAWAREPPSPSAGRPIVYPPMSQFFRPKRMMVGRPLDSDAARRDAAAEATGAADLLQRPAVLGRLCHRGDPAGRSASAGSRCST